MHKGIFSVTFYVNSVNVLQCYSVNDFNMCIFSASLTVCDCPVCLVMVENS